VLIIYHYLLKFIFLSLVSLVHLTTLIAETKATQSPISELKLVGEGKLSVLFWDVYQAKLYTKTGSYKDNIQPLALSFTYMRDFTSGELIDETEDQWRELKLDIHVNEVNWLKALAKLWPDVVEDDTLLFHINLEGNSDFYFNDRYLGTIEDEVFSRYFKAIWLDQNTSSPKIRKKLIGKQPG
jgi:hypothetical protein